VHGVGRELPKSRVNGEPLADPHLRPCMVVELASRIDEPGREPRRDVDGSGERGEKDRVLVAVSHTLVEHLSGARDQEGRRFREVLEDPIAQRPCFVDIRDPWVTSSACLRISGSLDWMKASARTRV